MIVTTERFHWPAQKESSSNHVLPQHPHPPAGESSNRQGPCIASQLAHAERFSQKKKKKNTHLCYFAEHIPWQQLFCFCEWQLTDNSMWAAKIFPLHCLSPKLITVRLYWQQNQRQSGMRGWWCWEGGRGGVLFLFHHIPTHHSLKPYGLVLIHFRLSKSGTAKRLFESKENVQLPLADTQERIANSSLMQSNSQGCAATSKTRKVWG